MKYLNFFYKYITESYGDPDNADKIRELINELDDDYFIEIDKEDWNTFTFVKDKADWNDFDSRFLKKKLDILKIDYNLSFNIWENMKIDFNRVDKNLIDSIVIIKYENDWFLLTLYINNDVSYYLCNDIEGLYHFIMENLFIYSKNPEFLTKLVEDKFELVTNFLRRDEGINNTEFNKFNFYKNEMLGQILIRRFHNSKSNPSLFESGNIVDYLIKNRINSISNLYYLLEKGIITKEQMQKQYPDSLTIDNGQLFMIFEGELSDLAFMFDDNSSSKSFVEEIDKYMEGGYLNYNFRDLYLGNLTQKALNCILAKIEELKKEMDEEELTEFYTYKTWEDQVENIDALSDLKHEIVNAYEEAQISADSTEMYKAVEDPIKTFFRMTDILHKDIDNTHVILVRINKDWLIRFDTFEDSTKYLGNGNLYHRAKILTDDILKEYFEEKDYNNDIIGAADPLKIKFPYQGWSGDIDIKYLEDIIEDKI